MCRRRHDQDPNMHAGPKKSVARDTDPKSRIYTNQYNSFHAEPGSGHRPSPSIICYCLMHEGANFTLDRAQLLVEPSSGHSKRTVQNLTNLHLYFQRVTR